MASEEGTLRLDASTVLIIEWETAASQLRHLQLGANKGRFLVEKFLDDWNLVLPL